MFLQDIFRLSDILSVVSCHLGICHIKIIRLTCKELSMITNADARHMSMSDTTAKYAHADLQPSGAFRIKSRVGLHYADIRALPGLRHLHSAPLPIVSMSFKGASFIGRAWAPYREVHEMQSQCRDFIDAKLRSEYGIKDLFYPASDILSAGNVWINSLDQKSNYFGDGDVTVLELTLDRGFVVVGGGKFRLSIFFKPIFESVGVEIQSDSPTSNKCALLLSNGAFRFNTLDGQMSVDIRSISDVRRLMMCCYSEDTSPLISMLYNGDMYIGKEWGNGGRSFAAFSESNDMFLPGSTVFQDLAGGVWISKLQHNVDNFYDGTLFTVLELKLDRGEQVQHGGEFCLRLLFTRI